MQRLHTSDLGGLSAYAVEAFVEMPDLWLPCRVNTVHFDRVAKALGIARPQPLPPSLLRLYLRHFAEKGWIPGPRAGE
jgi:hypothetical protein